MGRVVRVGHMEFQNGSKGVKLELGTEKVIEMKQGSWK